MKKNKSIWLVVVISAAVAALTVAALFAAKMCAKRRGLLCGDAFDCDFNDCDCYFDDDDDEMEAHHEEPETAE